tara:strand:- start:430 stop:753 length:324 start_codon:yes stop_codon:yes gene_type:complete
MKKQIDFDFSKWGQEGISVVIDGVPVAELHQNKIKGLIYGIDSIGLVFNRQGKDLKMFEEVKPREFWANVYRNRKPVFIHETKEDAAFASSSSPDFVKIIKLVEVIE